MFDTILNSIGSSLGLAGYGDNKPRDGNGRFCKESKAVNSGLAGAIRAVTKPTPRRTTIKVGATKIRL